MDSRPRDAAQAEERVERYRRTSRPTLTWRASSRVGRSTTLAALRTAGPEMPEGIASRDTDNWRRLIAIAATWVAITARTPSGLLHDHERPGHPSEELAAELAKMEYPPLPERQAGQADLSQPKSSYCGPPES